MVGKNKCKDGELERRVFLPYQKFHGSRFGILVAGCVEGGTGRALSLYNPTMHERTMPERGLLYEKGLSGRLSGCYLDLFKITGLFFLHTL